VGGGQVEWGGGFYRRWESESVGGWERAALQIVPKLTSIWLGQAEI